MDWTLIGSITAIIITVISGIAGIVQIIQYIEQHKAAGPQNHQGSQSTSRAARELPQDHSIPHNLPGRAFFIGREGKKKELYDILRFNARIVIVEGVAGIGKTSLALEVAYKYLEESSASRGKKRRKSAQFNAFIWITAKASTITIDSVLDILSRTLDYPYISQLQTEDKFTEGIKLLRKTKTLLIIDNFETINDKKVIQLIESIPEPSKALITTKYQTIWNTPFIPLALDKLEMEEGIEFIIDEAKRLMFKSLLQSDQIPLIDLYNATGGSPLAIKWAIGQMKQRGQSVKSIITMLNEARGDIFTTMFAESWDHLSDASKQILLTMPLFAATVSRNALVATSDVRDFDDGLGQLVELWLIESNRELFEESQRFSVHPLTRSFITRELAKFPSLEFQMHIRVAKYYLGFCNEQRHLQRGLNGYDHIEKEIANILKILEWLYSDCKSRSASETCQLIIDYSNAINVFFWSRGFWGERVFLCQQALEASKLLNDQQSAGRQAYFIGIVRFWQGKVTEAEDWAEKSKSFMASTGSLIDLALTERLMGLVEMGKGSYDQATAIHKTVLEKISQSTGVKPEEVGIFADWICPGPEGFKAGPISLMQELGIIANRRGDYSTAKQWLENSVVLAQQIGDVEGLSVSLSHLGNALYGLRQFHDAKTAYIRGLELATQVQRKSTMGRCSQGLASISSIQGNIREVIRYGKEAANFFERLGMQQEKKHVEELLECYQ